MKVEKLLKPGNILFEKEPDNKWMLLEKMVKSIVSEYSDDECPEEIKDLFLPAIMEREKSSSTAIGNGIALPHARIKGLNRPIIALSVVKEGIEFEAPDGNPVKIVFMFLFPGEKYDLAVKTQAAFAKLLSSPANVEKILTAPNSEAVHSFIKSRDINIGTPLVAEDLMRDPKVTLSPDITLHNATAVMGRKNADAAAVLDENDNIIGQVDSIYLLQKDLPDYIKEMHSVPPVHDFDPFTRYFSSDARVLVRDIMNRDFEKIGPQTSLLEIVFLLSVKKNSLLYVCKENKLLGVVDRITVLDKIFNL